MALYICDNSIPELSVKRKVTTDDLDEPKGQKTFNSSVKLFMSLFPPRLLIERLPINQKRRAGYVNKRNASFNHPSHNNQQILPNTVLELHVYTPLPPAASLSSR